MRIKQSLLTVTALALFALQITAQETAPLNALIRKQVIDSTCGALLRSYVYPDRAVVMANSIQQKWKQGGYDTLVERSRLANVLTRDLRSVQADDHLSVRYDPDLEKRVRAFRASGEKDKTEPLKEKKQNFFFRKALLLNGNIGYIEFTNFADTGEAARKTVRAAFQFVANADALILDLRNNFGGRPEMAKEMMAYFFDRPQLMGKTFNRIANSWTADWVGNSRKHAPDLVLTMPLYLLTSERTVSAAEGFAYNLQQVKKAVVVGDTTRGAAHVARSFALGNGFVGFVPFTRSENAKTKTDWEGVGVIPAFPVGEDSALSKAQALILERRLSTVRDETEVRKLRWLLNDLQAQWQKAVPEEVLEQYTGQFDEFLFTLENGNLFCRNTHQRNKKDRLAAINERLFKIDDQSQVEFIKEKNGMVGRIKLFWSDGWVDEVKKTPLTSKE